ncbi:MAG: mshD [Aeromicrobium sp.]|nr:mshD [Aeromicrobium sp.]
MIKYSWHERLPADTVAEVADLLAEAASYDAEAGFSTAVPDAPASGETSAHLVVSMPPKGERGSAQLDRLPDVGVVAYLRVDISDGVGDVQFVVRPLFRSLGVATLLFELLRDEDLGWASIPNLESIRGWAHGSHPAADRMSARFNGTVADAVFKTIRELGGSRPFVADKTNVEPVLVQEPGSVSAPVVAELHQVTIAPGDRRTLSRLATLFLEPEGGGRLLVGTDPDEASNAAACIAPLNAQGLKRDSLRTLIAQGLLIVQGRGARMAVLYVPPLDEDLLAVSRDLGFVHEQSDLRYVLAIERATSF